MLTDIDRLSAAGRDILAQKKASLDAETERQHAERLAIFKTARKAAQDVLSATGRVVLPAIMPEGFCPDHGRDGIAFYVWPFDDAPPIEVRIGLRREYRNTDDGREWVYSAYQMDCRHSYYVPVAWRYAGPDGNFTVRPISFEVTDSLPEAVALCEQSAGEWQEANANAAVAAERHKQLQQQPKPPRQKTPDEVLLESLRDWLMSELPESVAAQVG